MLDRRAREHALDAVGEHRRAARSARRRARTAASSSPWRPRPLSPVRTPRTAPSATSSCWTSVSGSTITPSSSACSAMKRVRRASEKTWLPLLCIGGGTIGSRAARELRQQVDGLALDRAVARHLRERLAREQLEQRRGLHDGARELVRADGAALVDERDRHLAERLGERRVALEQLRQPDRAGQPGRPAADDRDADLELLVGRRLGRGDDLGRRERRRVLSGRGRHAAIVLRAALGGRGWAKWHSRRCQVALAASATWPSASRLLSARCRSTSAPTP